MHARQTLKGESLFGREQINGYIYDAHAAVTFSCVAIYYVYSIQVVYLIMKIVTPCFNRPSLSCRSLVKYIVLEI